MTELLASIQAALGLASSSIRQTGQGALPSAFAVTRPGQRQHCRCRAGSR